MLPGDPAPAVHVGSWIQGKPVEKFEIGEVCVLEFCASWCGPCKEQMPELERLAKDYRGKVTFAGCAVWDKPSDSKKFARAEGKQVPFGLAYDSLPDGLENEPD